MQDQVFELQEKGIPAVYLIFVTPEWLAKPEKISALKRLDKAGKISLIAIDEAHLVSDWSDFRKAYLELGNLKHPFPNTPMMALTVTATPKVEMDIKQLPRSPLTVKASINRPNIKLHAFEIRAGNDDYYATFSEHVSDITQGEPALVYTDF